MYNLLIGPPGGGKSYEAVVYHVLPTLEAGRKVITNLPLNVAEFGLIDARFPALIELRLKSKRDGAVPFSVIEDYGDNWRDQKTGQGALYVIDECHKAIPRMPAMDARADQKKVEEWYAEHRHEGADLLLMTQSYGKISKAITDSAQVLYRVKKMTSFGKAKSYIRKVQDGVRGDVMSTSERQYEKQWFKLYKSHTRSVAAVLEADARDISPAYKKWTRAAVILLPIGLIIMAKGLFFGKADTKPPQTAAVEHGARTEEHAARSAVAVPQGPTESATMRLVGVYLSPGYSHVTVHTTSGDRRYPLEKCAKRPALGWQCEISGQIVNEYSGPEPVQSQGGGMMGVGGLLARAEG